MLCRPIVFSYNWLLVACCEPSCPLRAHMKLISAPSRSWVFGIFMLSLSTKYYQFLLSYSVCMGVSYERPVSDRR